MNIWGRFPQLTPVVLAVRNMRVRPWRTVLTCLGIVLGVAVMLAISVTNDSTLRSIRSVFDQASGKASLYVESSSADGQGFNQAALDRVRSLDGVVTAAPSVEASTLLARDAASWQIALSMNGQAANNTLRLVGVDPAIDQAVRIYTLTGGRWLRGKAYEAVVTEKYAADKNLKLGDDLVILSPGGQERLRLVGVIKRDGAGLLNDGTVAFAPLSVVQDVFERGHDLDAVDIVTTAEIANHPDQLASLKARLAGRLGRDFSVSYPAARGQLVTQMLSTYQNGLSFFSVVALFVGAYLIYNAFGMTVLERTREIGMLRALGATRAQVLGMVLTEAAVLAALGSVVGVGFGVVLARGLIWMLGTVVSTSVDLVDVPAAGLLQSVGVGVLVTLGSALAPALQAARVSPLNALRVQGRPQSRLSHRTWIAGLILFVGAWNSLYTIPWPSHAFEIGQASILLLLFGATLTVPLVVHFADVLVRPVAMVFFGKEGLLGASNVSRSAGRTALTVSSLMVGLAMVIATGSLSASFVHDITAWIDTALGGDLYVRAPIPMHESFERQLTSVAGVAGVTKIRYFQVKIAKSAIPAEAADQDTLIYAGIDPATYREVGDFEFAAGQGDPDANWTRFRQGDALFISNVVADRYKVRQGGVLRLVTRRGEHDFYVAGVATDFTGQGLIVTGSWNDMRRWFAQSSVDRFTVRLAPGFSVDEVTRTIEDRYKKSQNITVESTQEFKRKILALSQESFRLFDVLGLIGIVVAALGVINTLMMNVLERQREIGALRSLGLTRWQTIKMILAEAAAFGVIGGVFGLGFGFVLSQVFVRALNAMSGYDLKFVFNPPTFLAGVFIALGVSQAAAIYPAVKAAGVNIVEAIKHE